MCFILGMITISPNMRFSSSVAQGKISLRKDVTEKLNNRIFQNILNTYNGKKSCSINLIRKIYNSLLPENKHICINPLPKEDYENYGAGMQILSLGETITDYSIEVPANNKKKMDIHHLSSFMHESTHVLDFLLNPKYIANYRQMLEFNIFDKEYFMLYETWFDNPDAIIKNPKEEMLAKAEEEIKKVLKDIPKKEKIIFLNYIRYNMELETHAYSQDLKYAKLLKALHKPVDEENLEDYNKFMCFTEKIEIVNRILKDIIVK